MKIVIYETNRGEYVISSRGCWLPGVYADLKAARWAYQFPNVTLEKLSKTWVPITTEHLRKAKHDAEGKTPTRLSGLRYGRGVPETHQGQGEAL